MTRVNAATFFVYTVYTMYGLTRNHVQPDIDRGVIPDNPATLGGRRMPSYDAKNPFRFGGWNTAMDPRGLRGHRIYK